MLTHGMLAVPASAMSEPLVLAIDLGTSAVKTALVSADGSVSAGARRVLHGASPAGWRRSALATARLTLAGVDPQRVAGLALCGRGGATILCDAAGRALAPALTGTPPADFAAEAPARLRSLIWRVQQAAGQTPSLQHRLRWVLAAKDFLLLRLTGEAATDPASGPDALAWPGTDSTACISAEHLPAVRLPWEVAGSLQAGAASALGLPAGLPVVSGLHDGVAAQTGAGALQPETAALTLGTHIVLRAVRADAPAAAARFRFYSLWGERDGRGVYGGNARLGGAALSWAARLLGAGEASLPALERAAAAVPPGSDGLLFMPYLGGMVCPCRRPDLRGAWLGLRQQHGRGQLFRAVLEGTACAVRQIAAALAQSGVVPSRLTLTGGGARSALWRQILADALNQPLCASAAPNFAECVGAARCAWVALGHYPSVDAAIAGGLPPAVVAEPDAAGVQAMARIYDDFLAALTAGVTSV